MIKKVQDNNVSEKALATDAKVVDSKTLFWNRVQLIMILLVFIAPIAGAYFYKPSKFNNYGDLYIPARPVPALQLTDLEGQSSNLDALRKQWVFLVLTNEECPQMCEDNILKMRQLRHMQNNDMSRIRTVFLANNLPLNVAKDLHAKYRPIESYSINDNDYQQWRELLKLDDAPSEANVHRFYIIDPLGNLMMSYPASADPSYMKKDIKRLLKTSQIG